MIVELLELEFIRIKGEWKPKVMCLLTMVVSIYCNLRIMNVGLSDFNLTYSLISNLVFLAISVYFLYKIHVINLVKATHIINGDFDSMFDVMDDGDLCELLILYQASLIILERASMLTDLSFFSLYKNLVKVRRQEIKDLNKVIDDDMTYYDYKKNFILRKRYVREIYKDEDSMIISMFKTNRSLIL